MCLHMYCTCVYVQYMGFYPLFEGYDRENVAAPTDVLMHSCAQ